MTPKVYVLGAGSVGIFLATRLSSVAPVTLLVRAGRALCYSEGLRIVGLKTLEAVVPVMEIESLPALGDSDIVLIACKAFQLKEALLGIRSRLKPSQRVVFIQNGIGILDDVQATLPKARLGRMICWFGVRRLDERTVEWAGEGATDWAAADPEFSRDFAAVLAQAGFSPRLGATVPEFEWRKALMNLSLNALCALIEAPNGRVLEVPSLQRSAELLLDEAIAVGQKAGLALGESDRKRVWDGIRNVAKNYNSTYQDLQAGRPTEIPWLNGKIVELGRKLGVPTPGHELVVGLVSALEEQRIQKTLNSNLANRPS